MAITRFDPFDMINRMTDTFNLDFDFDRMFSWPEYFTSRWGVFEGEWAPALDMYENDDVPGMDPKDIDVQVTEDVLTIKGERKQVSDDETKSRQQRNERFYGSFHRTVPLNIPVNPDNVNAKMKDGVLYLTLPKKEEVKPKKISVKIS